ncbi:putative phosphatase regulatory subunit-domain-containing protein [Xylariales sp. PMI_506]|nr:putative phosphatase regulatory subunit-domain-containing protein [Xylariales sp. PMI_506]
MPYIHPSSQLPPSEASLQRAKIPPIRLERSQKVDRIFEIYPLNEVVTTPPVRHKITSNRKNKKVRFSGNLEHVRYFNSSESPSAGRTSYPTADITDRNGAAAVEFWRLRTPNLPSNRSPSTKHPACLERLYLSRDSNDIIGVVRVLNIAFEKLVAVRYSFDNWQTILDLSAQYKTEADSSGECDRFQFAIKLDDRPTERQAVLHLCVWYRVNGEEFWDNNEGLNFRLQLIPIISNFLPKSSQLHSSQVTDAERLPRALPSQSTSSSFLDYNFAITCPEDGLSDRPGQSCQAIRHGHFVPFKEKSGLPQKLSNTGLYGVTSLNEAHYSAVKPGMQSSQYEALIQKYCFFTPSNQQTTAIH